MPDRDLTNVQFPMVNSYPNRGRPHDSGAILTCIGRITGNPTSTSTENCALGIEHWSDPRTDAEQWILPSYFCASPKWPTYPIGHITMGGIVYEIENASPEFLEGLVRDACRRPGGKPTRGLRAADQSGGAVAANSQRSSPGESFPRLQVHAH